MQHSKLGFPPIFPWNALSCAPPSYEKVPLAVSLLFPKGTFQRLGNSSAVTWQRVAGSSSASLQMEIFEFPKPGRITNPQLNAGWNHLSQNPSPTWGVPIPPNSNNKASVSLQDVCHLLMPCQQTTELWESKPPKLIPALHSKCVPERSVLQKGQGRKFSSLGKNR